MARSGAELLGQSGTAAHFAFGLQLDEHGRDAVKSIHCERLKVRVQVAQEQH